MRFAWIDEHRGVWEVGRMCRVLEVTRKDLRGRRKDLRGRSSFF
jgi:hypothetical protein